MIEKTALELLPGDVLITNGQEIVDAFPYEDENGNYGVRIITDYIDIFVPEDAIYEVRSGRVTMTEDGPIRTAEGGDLWVAGE